MTMKPHTILATIVMTAAVFVAGCRSESRETAAESPAVPQVSAADSTARATPTTEPSPAATNPPPPVVLPEPIRINAGSSAITDAAGRHWLGDTGFSGGEVVERPNLEIANTDDPAIYRSEHYAMASFVYPVVNGNYRVKLHFCETFEGITGPGQRVFSFKVEDQEFKDFDVWAKAGGWGRAYVETVNVRVGDGRLDIQFTTQVENPQINGIEIIPVKSD
jgi:hypothetical protein